MGLVQSAQAASGTLQSNAALVTDPATWVASSSPAAGTAASASKAAGGSATRHICTGISVVISAGTALGGATTVTINLRDGASGAGSVLASWQFALPAAVVAPIVLTVTDLAIVGSSNTAMTLEGSANVGNLTESCVLVGYSVS